MSLFSWKPEYSVHVTELDRDHQQLFTLLNDIYDQVMCSHDLDRVLPAIDELSYYTEHHFTHEEQYMRMKQFSDMETHIARHREFADKIHQLRKNYHDNDLDVARELLIVLGEWLLQHVIKEDKKYASP